MPALKDVPTVMEEGFPDLIIQDWAGFLAKSGTPDGIVARLNGATSKAQAQPSVREAFAKIAAEPVGGVWRTRQVARLPECCQSSPRTK
jgi:tripartite-type tricarboxylate transporter receptor subunit TctC